MRDGRTDAKSLSCVIEGKKEELKEEDKQSLLKALCSETSVVSSDLVCVSGRMSAVVEQMACFCTTVCGNSSSRISVGRNTKNRRWYYQNKSWRNSICYLLISGFFFVIPCVVLLTDFVTLLPTMLS